MGRKYMALEFAVPCQTVFIIILGVVRIKNLHLIYKVYILI